MGWLAIKRQDFERAIALYEDLLKITPNPPAVLKRLAALYNRIGQREKSLALLRHLS